MKKQLYILITILVCISFIGTGCGSAENKSKAADTANKSSTETKAEFGQVTKEQKEAGIKFVKDLTKTLVKYLDEDKNIENELESIEKIEDPSERLAKKYDSAIRRYNLAVKYYKKFDEFSTAGMDQINALLAEQCRINAQQIMQCRVDEAELAAKTLSGESPKEKFESEFEHLKGLEKRYYADYKSNVTSLTKELQ